MFYRHLITIRTMREKSELCGNTKPERGDRTFPSPSSILIYHTKNTLAPRSGSYLFLIGALVQHFLVPLMTTLNNVLHIFLKRKREIPPDEYEYVLRKIHPTSRQGGPSSDQGGAQSIGRQRTKSEGAHRRSGKFSQPRGFSLEFSHVICFFMLYKKYKCCKWASLAFPFLLNLHRCLISAGNKMIFFCIVQLYCIITWRKSFFLCFFVSWNSFIFCNTDTVRSIIYANEERLISVTHFERILQYSSFILAPHKYSNKTS